MAEFLKHSEKNHIQALIKIGLRYFMVDKQTLLSYCLYSDFLDRKNIKNNVFLQI